MAIEAGERDANLPVFWKDADQLWRPDGRLLSRGMALSYGGDRFIH
jgi:hypothetical protein